MGTIVTIQKKENEKFLRKKTVAFDFSKHTKVEVRELVKRMREEMRRANGVGLSANQIGLTYRVFVAQVPDANGRPKFYVVFNPELAKLSDETETLEEGCLSIPETWGPVKRHYRVSLTGQDANGKPLKLKAWGLLARVFQHEVDHLNGGLFADKAEKLYRPEDFVESKKK
jgi:peptide deformylase